MISPIMVRATGEQLSPDYVRLVAECGPAAVTLKTRRDLLATYGGARALAYELARMLADDDRAGGRIDAAHAEREIAVSPAFHEARTWTA